MLQYKDKASQKLLGMFLLSSVALMVTMPGQAVAAEGQAFCDRDTDGTPATIVSNGQSSVVFIRWVRSFSSGSSWTPERRCDQVSRKFQQNFFEDSYQYLSPGFARSNGLPVICATLERHNDPVQCSDARVIMTLRPGDNAQSFVEQIVLLNRNSSSPAINHSSGSYTCNLVEAAANGQSLDCDDHSRSLDVHSFVDELSQYPRSRFEGQHPSRQDSCRGSLSLCN